MSARAVFLSVLGFLLLGLLLAPPPALGQYRRMVEPAAPAAYVGMNLLGAAPTGEFADFVDAGFGAEFFGRLALDRSGVVSLRGDLGFLVYGYESRRVCISQQVGCRVQARLETSNSIFFGGMGPELAYPGRFLRPYVNATVGFGYFATTSNLQSTWGGESLLTTQNLGDGTLALGVGWGVEMALTRGRVPVALSLGARYHEHGTVRYLREGDIVDHPDGSITLFPITSEANLVSYRLGVTVGISRPGSGEDRSRRGRRW